MEKKRRLFVVGNAGQTAADRLSDIEAYYEIAEYGRQSEDFAYADAVIICTGGDQEECLTLINDVNSNAEINDLPFIILSDIKSDDLEVMCLQSGAGDYFTADVASAVMRSRIDKVILTRDSANKLVKFANKDALTGFWNRNYIENYISGFSRRLDSEPDLGAVFMLLDMDNFKAVNDTFGHAVGDEVLVRFSEAIKAELNEGAKLCRLGGDEFVLFIAEDVSEDEVTIIAKRILASVEEALTGVVRESRDVSVSIGIARFPSDGDTFESLYMNADKALYHVKQNGKRGFHFYGEQVDYSIANRGEKNVIDIEELRAYINETKRATGAYAVHYDGFKRIYQFVSRCIERTRQDVQIVIYTLSCESRAMTNEERMDALDELNSCIGKILRRGDVATKYGDAQYVVILMDTNHENGSMVAERVKKNWREKYDNMDLTLEYTVDSVSKSSDN